MISALLDNYRFQHEAEGFKLKKSRSASASSAGSKSSLLQNFTNTITDKHALQCRSSQTLSNLCCARLIYR